MDPPAGGDPQRPLARLVHFPVDLLLLAGAIMVVTLFFSRKAGTVTRTSVSLARQDEGFERFGSSALSRVIVRMTYSLFEIIQKIIPVRIRVTIAERINPAIYKPRPASDGEPPAFDVLRASVNLIVASAIISFATSSSLPNSTPWS